MVKMRKRIILPVLMFIGIGCCGAQVRVSKTATPPTKSYPMQGPFTDVELRRFIALDPIDSHTHVYQSTPIFTAFLQRLNLHVLDILITRVPDRKDLDIERQQAWDFVRASNGHSSLCSTFNPFLYSQQGFSQAAIAEIDDDFAKGAVAVKIWRNLGELVKDPNGNYILPDNPVFEPIYKDIAAHNKTLIAHVADPDTMWQAPNPAADDYSSQTENSKWYFYNKPHPPSKAAILRARDHLLEENPNLRVVGAHLGSMEADFNQLSQHLDRYPNFAIDVAGRMAYFETRPRAEMIAFISKYQDRLIYGTDNEFDAGRNAKDTAQDWEDTYANDWRYFATRDIISYRDKKVQGLDLPPSIVRKIYHDNAVKWFPGILVSAQ